ncbi:MAG: UDP-glucose/GDP-mannose dehydrogenase family protein [Candidatus Electryonea clarkiae]|nr:UDP-glucose/GDP-mannose dehydrogenase family protein [Candidatus Electryonea clarkiae]MDP8289017.1 UDP-glucose/GDP-mannose dehydrogenase family protein [Candidatus Electryonea clarkiae]
MRLAVVGSGYVGLVAGACFASTGNHVVCVDIDEEKIKRLQAGKLPIYEPSLGTILQDGVAKNRLTFTTNLDEAVKTSEIIFIAVGTPPGEDGSADLKHVLNVAEGIGKSLNEYKVVVDKSTVPVGTAKLVKERIAKFSDIEVSVVSNPEFLKEGAAVGDFLKPDRVVIGADDEKAAKIMERLYRPFLRTGHPIVHMDVVSAELTKYAANAFLAMKISFMNEMAHLCEAVGANIDSIRRGISTDQRIGKHFLFAGAGYGGSCFPKDVQAILRTAKNYGVDLKLVNATEEVNERQKSVMVKKILDYYHGDVSSKTIAIWGLSFKPQTDDMREAPSIVIINSLLEKGAKIRAYDPVAMEVAQSIFDDRVYFARDEYDAAENADALVVVTEWIDFRTPDYSKLTQLIKDKVIFDGRNIYDPAYVNNSGLEYYGIGK